MMDALAIRYKSLARLTDTLNGPTNAQIQPVRAVTQRKSKTPHRALRLQSFVRRLSLRAPIRPADDVRPRASHGNRPHGDYV